MLLTREIHDEAKMLEQLIKISNPKSLKNKLISYTKYISTMKVDAFAKRISKSKCYSGPSRRAY